MSTSPPSHCCIPINPSSSIMKITALPATSSMEIAASPGRAEIDTSRPFQSVREAVEVFGERCVTGGGSRSHASSESSSKFSMPPASPSSTVLGCLKKLEADLAEAKSELVQLKQRQSQMEMAVTSITVQFSNGLDVFSNFKKGKELAVVDAGSTVIGAEEDNGQVRSDRWDESRAEEWMESLEYLPSLSQALTIKMIEDDLGERRERKVVKSKKAKKKLHKKQKKNGISLVGGIFSNKDKSREI